MMQVPRTLWNRWLQNAQNNPDQDAVIHWAAEKDPIRWTWSRLMSAACALAERLAGAGVQKGQVCALIIRHHPDFYPLYMAVSSIGAVPAVLQYPNSRIHPDKFRQGIEGMSRHSGLDWILTEKELNEKLAPSLSRPGSTIRGMIFPLETGGPALRGGGGEWRRAQYDVNESDECLLQHSSGTTGLQKAVMLSHAAVLNHLDSYARSIDAGTDDKIASWLPLYHDMGLIAAFHMSLALAIPLIQLDPFEWVAAPFLLLEAVSKEKGTLTWLPNFAFNLTADKVLDEELDHVSLKSWRMIINCSEPVRHESMEKFFRKLSSRGLDRHALSSAYAMAETTFAVTQSAPGSEPLVVSVDREKLSKGAVSVVRGDSNARVCVSSGKTIGGCEVRILDKDGEELPEDRVGEFVIRSDSMFRGYRNDPAQTDKALKNGWYHSGDYGFRHRDAYFIVGRKKDMIIVGGNNIFPEDIEDALSSVPGMIPGRIVAFGEFDPELGTEQVCVIAESGTAGADEHKRLRREAMAAAAAIDVTIRHLYLVPPRWLIKSSSGKPARKANRERIHEIIPIV